MCEHQKNIPLALIVFGPCEQCELERHTQEVVAASIKLRQVMREAGMRAPGETGVGT